MILTGDRLVTYNRGVQMDTFICVVERKNVIQQEVEIWRIQQRTKFWNKP